MNWSNKAWKEVEPIYQHIISMPFIQELMSGTLEVEKFRFYIAQDSHYLEHFARALSLIASRIENIDDSLTFMRFAEGAIIVESALHESYFKDFGVEKGRIQPTCHHYISFLKCSAALENVEVAVAAVLPCFWIYKEVGDYIYKNQKSLDNPFKKWIETYAGEEFALIVDKAIAIGNRLAKHTSSRQQVAMTAAFITASRLEYEFWDSAYILKTW